MRSLRPERGQAKREQWLRQGVTVARTTQTLKEVESRPWCRALPNTKHQTQSTKHNIIAGLKQTMEQQHDDLT